jgi:threonine aldolase
MGNLVAMMAHLGRGQEAIVGRQTHVVMDEAASYAVIASAGVTTIAERADGTMDPAEIRDAFRDPTDVHQPITGLVVVEDTHAHSMGQPIGVPYLREVAAIAHERGVPLHVDGARFWNAAVALGVSGAELAAPADTVSFCLSKGLACPVGSLVVGSREAIWRARRARKMLGGGMRQVGVLAAPGLIALRDGPRGMIERLAEDHANARRLAEAIAEMPGIVSPGDIAQPGDGPLDPSRVRTNFVLFRVERDRDAFLAALERRDVLVEPYPHRQVRAVTHHGIGGQEIEATIAAIRDALAETASRRPASAALATSA